MRVTETPISGVCIVEPRVFFDYRGFFLESWNAREFADLGMKVVFVQDSHSGSIGGSLRGLHYQIRQPQAKLVRCLTGEIFDVAVDLRRSSSTFGSWVGVKLSAENRWSLWMTEGIAHGFYVMTETAEVLYKATDYYAPEHERCILWDDPAIGIKWPMSRNTRVVISPKDLAGCLLKDAEVFP